jgi:hypothetical protein
MVGFSFRISSRSSRPVFNHAGYGESLHCAVACGLAGTRMAVNGYHRVKEPEPKRDDGRFVP